MKQVIQVEPNDTIAVIRNKLEEAQSSEVLLVVPAENEALRNLVYLKLLRRYADNLALSLALVAEDATTRTLAREAGIVLAPSPEKGQAMDIRALERRLLGRRKKVELPAEERRAAAALEREEVLTPRRKAANWQRLALSGALFIILLAAVALAVPSATVRLTPATTPVEGEMEIVAVKDLSEINYGTAEIPARTVSVEIEGQDRIATTGRRDVPDTRAQGIVVLTNKTPQAITVTKGTIVCTTAGTNVRFYTITDVGLPPTQGTSFGTARVGIVAMEPGPSGNVGALTINKVEGELEFLVDVLNEAPTTGGAVKRVSVVANDDRSRLQAQLVKRLQEEAYNKLVSELKGYEFIPPGSLQVTVLSAEFDNAVDAVTETLGMRAVVRVTGLAVDQQSAEALITRLLETKLPSGYQLLPDETQFQRGDILNATPERVRFVLRANGLAAPRLDIGKVKATIRGKGIEAAVTALKRTLTLASEPQIEVSPTGWKWVPWWDARIRIEQVASEK